MTRDPFAVYNTGVARARHAAYDEQPVAWCAAKDCQRTAGRKWGLCGGHASAVTRGDVVVLDDQLDDGRWFQ